MDARIVLIIVAVVLLGDWLKAPEKPEKLSFRESAYKSNDKFCAKLRVNYCKKENR